MTLKPYKHPLGTIELLEGTNYATWKRQCVRVLKGIKAWKIVLGEEQQPNNPVGFTTAVIAEQAVFATKPALSSVYLAAMRSRCRLKRLMIPRKCGRRLQGRWMQPVRLSDE